MPERNDFSVCFWWPLNVLNEAVGPEPIGLIEAVK